MSQRCKDHENLCVYDQYTLHVDVDVAPDYSQEEKTRRGVAQDGAASSGRQPAQRRRQELLKHACGGAKYAVRRFPPRARRWLGGTRTPRAATRTLPARNNPKRGDFCLRRSLGEFAGELGGERSRNNPKRRIRRASTRAWAKFARTQQSQTV